MSNKFEIKSVRPSRKLVMAVSRKRSEVPLEVIKQSLGRNIMTVLQLCELTGVSQNRVLVLSATAENPKAHKNTLNLKRVYPFPTTDKTGPIFILRDEDCDEFILQSNK